MFPDGSSVRTLQKQLDEIITTSISQVLSKTAIEDIKEKDNEEDTPKKTDEDKLTLINRRRGIDRRNIGAMAGAASAQAMQKI